MGLFDIFKKQLIDVIDWTEERAGVLSYRYPMQDREIQSGAQLTVRESQLALFVNEGKVADLFRPGLHTLTTRTLPILTTLKNWDKAFQSPFKSDVFFFSTRDQLDQRWGTPAPIVINDKQFGALRIRAHGTFSYRIKDPTIFFTKVSATESEFTTEEMDGQLRSAILTNLASFLGRSGISFVEMAANQLQFSETLKNALAPMFAGYGLALEGFFVQSVSLPEELQGHLDKAASMRMVGDLKNYAQFQTAESIPLAAQNEGGVAGIGAGLGFGMAMSQAMSGATSQAANAGLAENPMDTIKKLHEMAKNGIITQQEFEAKKAELLKKIT